MKEQKKLSFDELIAVIQEGDDSYISFDMKPDGGNGEISVVIKYFYNWNEIYSVFFGRDDDADKEDWSLSEESLTRLVFYISMCLPSIADHPELSNAIEVIIGRVRDADMQGQRWPYRKSTHN